MLSYGRIARHLSRITRLHVNSNNIYEDFKHSAFLNISCSKYSSKKTSDTQSSLDQTKEKVLKKVPPLPTPPSSPPSTADASSAIHNHASCDKSQCPPTCPVYEECMKDEKPPSNYMYWKQILVGLILTGISLYVFKDSIFEGSDNKGGSKNEKDKKKKKDLIPPSPLNSSDIPAEVPYLLIGGGTAAFAAFRAIKASDPKAKVLVITKEVENPYMRPPLSKELWYNKDKISLDKLTFKQWNGSKRSLFYEHPEFYLNVKELVSSEKGGVAVAKGWSVKKIDVFNKYVYLEDDHKIKYDKCLIATGASPKSLTIFDDADDNVQNKVITFRTKEDFVQLVNNISKPDVKDIVIIGGGFLGSELACSLARNVTAGKQKVHQVFKEKALLAQVLPEYLSEWTTAQAQLEGVHCIPNVEVKDYKMENDKLKLILSNGQILPADQVIVAIGVEANTDFADNSGLETDPEQGGLLVNAELEARRDLWVAGDVANFYDVKLGRRRIEHHDHAVISGRLAGENMTGAKKPYTHQSMFWSDLGPEVGFEAIGIIDSNLKTVGVFAKGEKDASKNLTLSSGSTSTQIEKGKVESKNEDKNTKTESPRETVIKKPDSPKAPSEYEKGIVFYLRNNTVVGIVLWNIFNRMSIARQILARDTNIDELSEVSKLFTIHEDE